MLEARSLDIGYGTRRVVAGVDLAVGPGEVLCLLGPNGAGKTTLFKTLLGLIPPLSGEVRLAGRRLEDLSRAEIARLTAYVPQAQAMEFAYSVLDLVLMGRTAHLGPFSAPGAADRERAYGALEELGVAELAAAKATEISGGQRQLALIARALAQDARLLVMDEPTASLDFGNSLLVLDRVRRLRESGYAIVFSTHSPDQVFGLGTTVAVVSDGRVTAHGPPDVALTPAVLSQAYGVPIAIERTESGRHVVAPARQAAGKDGFP